MNWISYIEIYIIVKNEREIIQIYIIVKKATAVVNFVKYRLIADPKTYLFIIKRLFIYFTTVKRSFVFIISLSDLRCYAIAALRSPLSSLLVTHAEVTLLTSFSCACPRGCRLQSELRRSRDKRGSKLSPLITRLVNGVYRANKTRAEESHFRLTDCNKF